MRGQTELEFLQETIYKSNEQIAELKCGIRIFKRLHDKPMVKNYETLLQRAKECRRELEAIRSKMLRE